jgi:hypothetical protein
MTNYRFFAPVENFSSEEDIIDFGEGLTLKRLSEIERKGINRVVKDIFKDVHDLNDFAFLFNSSDGDEKKFSRSIEKAICCLRLFKKGNIGIKYEIRFEVKEGDEFHLSFGMKNVEYYFGFGDYKVLKTDVQNFKNFKDKFYRTKISSSGFWSLAQRRFNSSYGSRKTDDKLIDFTIGLEALFSEGPGDLTYKLSNRIARLLSKNMEERIKISIAIKKIYDFRSRIVHGEATRDPDFEANVDRAEHYLRLSLNEILNLINIHGENKDDILKVIDFNL